MFYDSLYLSLLFLFVWVFVVVEQSGCEVDSRCDTRVYTLLSAVPARLSKLSLLNAIRSGTYVVNEPPPTTTTTTTADNEVDENIENKDIDQPPDANAVNARMTDNGIVANEDNVQVALTKMPEDALQEPEVNSTLPLGPSRKIHSMHR